MIENGTGVSLNPDKKGFTLKILIPGSTERAARQKDSGEIFRKALNLVQNDNPQPANWQENPEYHRGLRVDYFDIEGDHESQAHIIWNPRPDEAEPTQLLLIINKQNYQLAKTKDGFDVIAVSGFKWHKKGRKEDGLITKTYALTQKGRAEVLKVLDELPNATRRIYKRTVTDRRDDRISDGQE